MRTIDKTVRKMDGTVLIVTVVFRKDFLPNLFITIY
jgi:hypothetical protein